MLSLSRPQIFALIGWSVLFGACLAFLGAVLVSSNGSWAPPVLFAWFAGAALLRRLLAALHSSRAVSIEAMLARFPGTLELRPNRSRQLIWLLVWFVLPVVYGATGLYSTALRWSNGLPAEEVIFLAVSVGVLGLIGAVLVRSVTSNDGLSLTPDGFTLNLGLRDYSKRWETCRDFRVEADLPLVAFAAIGYEDLSGGLDKGRRARKMPLPEVFDLTPEQFAQLLNAWRERALSPPG